MPVHSGQTGWVEVNAEQYVDRHVEGSGQDQLDRRDVADDEHDAGRVRRQQPGPGPAYPAGDRREALAAGRRDVGRRSPGCHLGRVRLGRLSHRQPLPGTEVGLDEIVVGAYLSVEKLRHDVGGLAGTAKW